MIEGRLVVCPTPIGNLGDMTLRGLEALRNADVVCAEDTRITGKLLAAYEIRKRLERLDEATLSKSIESVVARIREGENIVYCSDAGMPGVSDPGLRLVRAVQEAGLRVEVLPGPTASIAAYVASGFTNACFFFGGFFPRRTAEQEKVIESLKDLDAVLLFYESPSRLVSALDAISKCFPEREVAVCRELSKIHEEVFRALSREVFDEFQRREKSGAIKGEIVLVIDAPSAAEQMRKTNDALEAAKEKARELAFAGELSKKDIVFLLQQEFAISRNAAYEIVVGL